jgi:hypothetical protein
MTTIYGSTPFSIVDNLKEQGHLKFFKKKELILIFSTIINSFNENFNGLNIIKNTLKYIAIFLYENKKPIKMFIEENYPIFNYNYSELDYDIIKNDNKKINIKIELNNKSNISKKKLISGILANFIHFLDGYVLHKTRINLKEKNIDCLGIHDCFIINGNYYEECLKEYNKNLSKILDINILNCFNIDENEFFNFLDTYKNEQNKKISKNMKENIINLLKLKKKNISKNKILNSNFSLLPT